MDCTGSLIDQFGNTVDLPLPIREFAGFSREGISPVRLQNRETAVIDTSGKVLFKTGLSILSRFENGMSVFRDPISNKQGVYSLAGDRVVNAEYDWISPFCDGYAVALRKGSTHVVLDLKGRIAAVINRMDITLECELAQPCGQLVVFRDPDSNLMGFIDFNCETVIPARFREAMPFREGFARICSSARGLYGGFINPQGEFVIEPRFPIDSELLVETSDFSEGIAFVPSTDSLDAKIAIDNEGRELFALEALTIFNMVENRAAFFDHKIRKWGYVDRAGATVIEPAYDKITDFGGGIAVVEKS